MAPKPNKLLYVVDDCTSYGYLLSKVLNIHGFEVRTFINPLEALDELGKNKPDLILSDIEMPKMTGFQFYNHVRKKYSSSQIPFLFISSTECEDHKSLALALSKYPVLKNPFPIESLLNAIRSVMHTTRRAKSRKFYFE